ncbi:MAG: transposase family protein [Azonexus sp.]|jgi:hypothetical protein|nr:transposase family protein [Azonexus sp.]
MKQDEGVAALVARFAGLPDKRVEGRTEHDLVGIVVLALCVVMSGAEGWDDIEDWGRAREGWLRKYLLALRDTRSRHHTAGL